MSFAQATVRIERIKQLEDGTYINKMGDPIALQDHVAILVPRKSKWVRGDYMLSFQKSLEDIAAMRLTGEQNSVLMLLMAKTNFENYISITQDEIAKALAMQRANVSRAIKVLTEMNVIKKIKQGTSNFYLFNPDICFKGQKKNYSNVYNLFNSDGVS